MLHRVEVTFCWFAGHEVIEPHSHVWETTIRFVPVKIGGDGMGADAVAVRQVCDRVIGERWAGFLHTADRTEPCLVPGPDKSWVPVRLPVRRWAETPTIERVAETLLVDLSSELVRFGPVESMTVAESSRNAVTVTPARTPARHRTVGRSIGERMRLPRETSR